MRFNYSLDYNDYSLKNALLWGNCCKHFQKTSDGRLGNRIVHALIGTAELLPIISQISSTFEMIIVTQLDDHSRAHNDPSFSTKLNNIEPILQPDSTSHAEESFDTFKERVLSELPKNIKRQKHQPSYQRQKLRSITERSRNLPIELNKPPKEIEFYAKGATFYGYNAESIRDYGWGCAWRTIQTSLSSYNINTSFADLFHTFGPLHNLSKIYQDKYPNENLTSSKKFAPYEISSGWAEPFIGEMVMHFYGISAELESINGIPGGCLAPKSVFHHPSLSFSAFKNRLENHFKNENAAPIMIDDGTYALNIIGIGSRDSATILWIADPHIQEGVNHSTTEETPNGLYTITLDASGNQASCSLNENDQHQKSNLFSAGSYHGLDFNQKHWTALFPNQS